MTRPTWDQRIARAGELAEMFPFAAEVLGFYTNVARYQKALYGYVQQARSKPFESHRNFPELASKIFYDSID